MLAVFLLFFLITAFLLRYNFFRVPKKGILVLLYHRIDDKPVGTDLDKFSISKETFEKQVAYLKRKKFFSAHPGNMEEIVEKKLYLKNRYVLFTFDDGYKDNLYAAKILNRYGYRGIFFISTAHIGKSLDGVDMLTSEDLKSLVNLGMFLGSHSNRHINLQKLTLAEIKKEILQSLDILSQYQGDIGDFAYPFGGYNDEIVGLISDLGIERAYIIGQKIYQPTVHSTLKIPRAIVRKNMDYIDFYLISTRGRSRF